MEVQGERGHQGAGSGAHKGTGLLTLLEVGWTRSPSGLAMRVADGARCPGQCLLVRMLTQSRL